MTDEMTPDDLKVLSNELFALAAKPAAYNQTLYEGMASYASARASAAYHAWVADRKAMWAAYNLLERADHQYYDSEAEAILGAALRGEEER
jgi:hypothetical protein